MSKNTTAAKTKSPTKAQLAKAAALFGTEATAPVLETPAVLKSGLADFVAQQLTPPASPVVTAPVPTHTPEEFAAALEKLQADFGVAVKVVNPAKAASTKVQSNDVTRPGADTLCGKVFAAADTNTATAGRTATIAEVKVACTGINDHTVKTQYARWRKYNGVTGRAVAPVVIVPAPETPAAE